CFRLLDALELANLVRATVVWPAEADRANQVRVLGLFDRQEIDDEHERLVRLDHGARASGAVGHGGWDRQLAPAADPHALAAGIPARDHLALPELELERLAAIPRCIEFLAGRERDADVMHLDLLAPCRLVSVADDD